MDSMTAHIGSVSPLAWLTVLVIIIYLRGVIKWRTRSGGRPYPPGPKRWPLFGNMFNAPRFKPWIGYRDLCSRYGDLVYVRLLGQSMLVLGSPTIINEYLEKRSAITSDRHQTPLIELTGCDLNFGLFPYGQRWRHHRRIFWQHFTPKAVAHYQDVQRAMAHKFLDRLIQDPAQFREHIRHNFSSTMLKILYDIDAADKNDLYISHVDAALEAVSQGLVPAKFLVEFIPALFYLPSWFPGAGAQELFAKWRAASMTLKHAPFSHVKMTETFSTLQAVSLYPGVLKKAQIELDSVVGPTRLPDLSDQSKLVYVSAIVKEALRWHNVIPLCIPHCLLEDDEFHGYFIPEGTVILPNIWACMHDPEAYEDPDEFRPERFIRDGQLDPSVRDPVNFVFGFGRRICPGRHFAQASLFINVASILHTFDITPPLDEFGLPIEVVSGMTDGLLSYPEDIRCTIKPRSPWAESLADEMLLR